MTSQEPNAGTYFGIMFRRDSKLTISVKTMTYSVRKRERDGSKVAVIVLHYYTLLLHIFVVESGSRELWL